ncbi:lipopolysaccharide biosynthesis protein [Paenibacillus sp. LjRoot153]|uniref:lipopolysaccharide biosynthesis protein n=1 Tax=Paenibacillus sp. LjRoot153 TaxID=3342270 RepID=UPI003ECFC570
MGKSSLGSKVIAASKWSMLSELGTKAFTPLIFVILARILTPEDYGVVSIAAMVITFSQIFWDTGFSRIIIQYKSEEGIDKIANVIFWVNIILGIVIYIFIFFSADLFSQWFHDYRIKDVLRMQGIQVVFSSFSSIQSAIFQREFNYKPLTIIRIVSIIIPGIVSLSLSLFGMGYWSLVYGTLVGSVLQSIIMWNLSSWKPKLRFETKLLKHLTNYGIWITLEGLLTWFFSWIDSFVVGTYFNTHDLGVYRTGNTFVSMIFGLLLSPILPVLFSMFSRLQDNPEEFKEKLHKVSKFASLISIPIGAGLFLTADNISFVVFGENWTGVSQVIAFLGLANGISWIVGANEEAYRAIGRADINTKLMIFRIILYLPTLFLIQDYGMQAVLWTRIFIVLLVIPINIVLGKRYFDIDLKPVVRNISWIVISTLGMVILLTLIKNGLFLSGLSTLIILVVCGASCFIMLLAVKEKSFIKECINLLIRKT